MKTASKILFVLILMLSISMTVIAQDISVDIERSTCVWDNMGQPALIPGATAHIALRYQNNTGSAIRGMTNGYKISSASGTGLIQPLMYTNPDLNWDDYFDQPIGINRFSYFLLGNDYVIGVTEVAIIKSGLPDGFNDIAYFIRTGISEAGDVLCIDSSFFPPTGMWLWSNGYTPTWGGPYCFEAVNPGALLEVQNCPGTINITSCDNASYQFNVSNGGCPDQQSCSVVSGPGSISDDGLYTYNYNPDDEGSTQSVTINMTSEPGCCFNYDVSCTFDIFVSISEFRLPGDVNTDCQSDVADLVFLIDYQFRGGEVPPVFELGDCDGSGIHDVEDVVYLVDYQFRGGPPPVVPW